MSLERRKKIPHYVTLHFTTEPCREGLSVEGLELAPLMSRQVTGRPRRDPETGYMMDHGLSSTDITRHAAARG